MTPENERALWGLYYSIYCSGKDAVLALPEQVQLAYATVSAPHAKTRALYVEGILDPVAYVNTALESAAS